MIAASAFVHPTAVIDPGALIGEHSKVWHFTHVMPTAEIGAHCSLGQNVFVADRVKLGNHVRVQNNVSLYEGVACADHVFIGPSVVFTNVLRPRAEYPASGRYLPTLVERGASIGANATIICGNRIGAYALIGAGSVVTAPVPAHALVVGNPARLRGWVSARGERLDFRDGTARCAASGESYALDATTQTVHAV